MIFAVASQKGGVGKTTTSISLAAGVARQGKRVLLIDIDSQANSSKVLLPHYAQIPQKETIYQTIIQRAPLVVHQSSVPQLFVVPSHILLSNADVDLTTALDHREARLKQRLDEIASQFDHVFIDCPPAISWLTLNALTASDRVLLVVSPGYFELDSIVQLGKTVEIVRKDFNPQLEMAGLLFVMGDQTVNTRTSLEILRKYYVSLLFKTTIPRNTDIRDAHFNKQDIFSFNPQSSSARSYMKLIEELAL
jgi:chromosome partitioning protein